MAKKFQTGNLVTVTSGTQPSFDGTVRTATLESNAEIHDITVMDGGTVRERLPGLKDWTLNLEMLFDTDAAGQDAADLVEGDPITVVITIGGVTGDRVFTMTTGILESYNLVANVDGIVTISIVARADGTAVVVSNTA